MPTVRGREVHSGSTGTSEAPGSHWNFSRVAWVPIVVKRGQTAQLAAKQAAGQQTGGLICIVYENKSEI